MRIDIDDIVARYNTEIAKLTQRAIIAEAQVASLTGENEQLRESLPKEE